MHGSIKILIIIFFIIIVLTYSYSYAPIKNKALISPPSDSTVSSPMYISSDPSGNLIFDPISPLSYPQNQTKPSNKFNTNYRNTTFRPLFISVCDSGAAGVHTLNAYCDSVEPPATIVASSIGGQSEMGCSVFFIVLPNFYYMVSSSDPKSIVISWIEWK